VLLVGTELGDSDLWGGAIEPRGRVVRVDIDAGQLHKNLAADVPVRGDALSVLSSVASALEPASLSGAARAAATRDEITKAALVDGQPWKAIQDVLREALPADTIVAGDSSQVSYYGTVHFWPMEEPGRFLYPPGYATLGYGLPAGIGAAVGAPGRPVVVLVGDGAFMFTVQELMTAVEQRLPIPVVVVDNGGYAEIRAQMDERGIPRTGVDLERPDFAALGQVFGAYGHRVPDVAALADVVPAALTADRPTVLHLAL
jgi:acetolactate synthase-1/2/3 large subunit